MEAEYTRYEENSILNVSIQSIIGNRYEQQDCSDYILQSDSGLIVVCDGMGGHAGGSMASKIATDNFIRVFKDTVEIDDEIQVKFMAAVSEADMAVYDLKSDDGSRMNAGSTVVAVYIKDKKLYWAAVGDSRIYIVRNDEICNINTSHTYKWQLEKQRNIGQITEEEYESKLVYGEQLVSYIGAGHPEPELIDINMVPFELMSEDRILLTTDGLFKILEDDEIRNILMNFKDIKEAARALIVKTKRKGEGRLDNVTLAIVKIK
ncbi:MAG: serine/threonine-protein phosphatase [Lachnospiraceae bacterium]|nr:serine/threonine-protein phosphatase [Lachnospiraceae bacterium]